MANTDSGIISSLIATPPVQVPVGELGGRLRVAIGTAAVADGDFDADGDTIRLARLPSHARVIDIALYSDDLDAGTDSAVNVGIQTSGGTIVDEDVFATAITTLRAATLVPTFIGFEARNITAMGNALWEDAGESSDPGVMYDITLYQTATVTTDAAGDVSFIILYTID